MRFAQNHRDARYQIRQGGVSLNEFHRIIVNQHNNGGLSLAWLDSRWENNAVVKHYAEQYLQRYDYLQPMIERKMKEASQ
jgi:hypothetical protein